MARGAIAKKEIMDKILSTFEGSFLYNNNKEIRIPIMEDGELIQIKVTLTAAKENVAQGDDNAIPGSDTVTPVINGPVLTHAVAKEETKIVEPTAQEKENVRDLLAALGL